jgi:hypothetical protein
MSMSAYQPREEEEGQSGVIKLNPKNIIFPKDLP